MNSGYVYEGPSGQLLPLSQLRPHVNPGHTTAISNVQHAVPATNHGDFYVSSMPLIGETKETLLLVNEAASEVLFYPGLGDMNVAVREPDEFYQQVVEGMPQQPVMDVDLNLADVEHTGQSHIGFLPVTWSQPQLSSEEGQGLATFSEMAQSVLQTDTMYHTSIEQDGNHGNAISSKGKSRTGKRKQAMKKHEVTPILTGVYTGSDAVAAASIVRDGQFVCTHCSEAVATQWDLRQHIRRCHLGKTPFQCGICNAKFSREKHLVEHVYKLHPGNDPYMNGAERSEKTGKKKCFQCPSCLALFTLLHNLKTHMQKFHSESTLHCTECSAKFSKQKTYDEHMKMHEKRRTILVCDNCSLPFTNLHNIKRHMMRAHTGMMSVKCDKCSATFTKLSHLRIHKRTLHPECLPEVVEDQCVRRQKISKRKKASDKSMTNEVALPDTLESLLRVEEQAIVETVDDSGNTLLTELAVVSIADDESTSGNRNHVEVTAIVESRNEDCEAMRGISGIMDSQVAPATEFAMEGPNTCVAASGNNADMESQMVPKLGMNTGVASNKCYQCSAVFNTEAYLQTHIQKVHTGETPFQCLVCGARFTMKRHLSSHVRIHSTGQVDSPLKQVKLDLSAKPVNAVIKKIKAQKLFNKCFPCPKCSAGFTMPSNLRRHMKRAHSGNVIYPCNLCSATFSLHRPLLNHLKKHARDDNNGQVPRQYSCEQCGALFKNPHNRRRHVKRAHTGTMPYKCNLCDAAFTKLLFLTQHESVHSTQKPYAPVFCRLEPEFMPDTCRDTGYPKDPTDTRSTHDDHVNQGESADQAASQGQTGTLSSNVERLSQKQTGPFMSKSIYLNEPGLNARKLTKCEECSAEFASEKILQIHSERVHGGQTSFQCEVCGARFARQRQLTIHLKLHSGQKPTAASDGKFECVYCSATFSLDRNLKRHIQRAHSGDTPFECTNCEACFSKKGLLSRHKRTRHGQSESKLDLGGLLEQKLKNDTQLKNIPVCCKRCSAPFYSSFNLKRHVDRVHTGPTPHKCNKCFASFSHRQHLTAHLLVHNQQASSSSGQQATQGTEKVSYACVYCSLRFTNMHNLRRHIRRAHDGIMRFACPVCSAKFSKRCHLNSHLRRIHPELMACIVDNVDDENPADTGGEEGTTREETSIAASDNDGEGLNSSNEPVYVYTRKRVKCGECFALFFNNYNLERHVKRAHTGPTPHECKVCLAKFSHSRHLTDHESLHVDNTVMFGGKTVTGKKQFKCQMCLLRFTNMSNARRHFQRAHTGNMSHQCSKCGATFTKVRHLNVHSKNIHGCHIDDSDKKPWRKTCQKKKKGTENTRDKEQDKSSQDENLNKVSNSKTIDKAVLSSHSKPMTDQKCATKSKKSFECMNCHVVFDHKGQLTSHCRRAHTGQMIYKCDVCPASFCGKKYLNDHMKSHPSGNQEPEMLEVSTGLEAVQTVDPVAHSDQTSKPKRQKMLQGSGKAVKCSHCCLPFSSDFNLRRHIDIAHTGSTPHHCEQCTASFTNTQQLHAHMAIHAGSQYDGNLSVVGIDEEMEFNKLEDGGSLDCQNEKSDENKSKCTKSKIVHKSAPKKKAEFITKASSKVPSGHEVSGGGIVPEHVYTKDKQNVLAQAPHEYLAKPTVNENRMTLPQNAARQKHGLHIKLAQKSRNMKEQHLKKQKRLEESDKAFKCSHCCLLCSSYFNLKRHVDRAHTGNTPYHCSLCTATFTKKRHLQVHMLSHEGGSETDGNSSAVENEETELFMSEELDYHSENSLVKVKSTQSKIVDKSPRWKADAITKSSNTVPSRHENSEGGIILEHGYTKDKLIHRSPRKIKRQYLCNMCSEAFMTASGVARHIRVTHRGPKAVHCHQTSTHDAHVASLSKANTQDNSTENLSENANVLVKSEKNDESTPRDNNVEKSSGAAASQSGVSIDIAQCSKEGQQTDSEDDNINEIFRDILAAKKTSSAVHDRNVFCDTGDSIDGCKDQFSVNTTFESDISTATTSEGLSAMAMLSGSKLCAECGAVFSNTFNLRRHIDRAHIGNTPFHCVDCPATFSTQRHLKAHSGIHEAVEETSRCTEHRASASQVNMVSETPAESSECDQSQHDSIIANEISSVNTENSDSYINLSLSEDSAAMLENPLPALGMGRVVKIHSCFNCSMTVTSAAHLRRHILRAHTGEMPHHCPHCPATFTKHRLLATHSRLHGANQGSETGQGVMPNDHPDTQLGGDEKCDTSEPNCSRDETLNVGGMLKTKEDIDSVQNATKSDQSMSVGVSRTSPVFVKEEMSDNVPVDAVENGTVAESTAKSDTSDPVPMVLVANRHAASECGSHRYACRYCSLNFTSRYNMKRHIQRAHSGPMTYHCKICSASFSRLRHYMDHGVVHFGSKLRTTGFKCKNCGSNYLQKHHLMRHISRAHTGDMPYVCSQCSGSFCKPEQLHFHINNIHNKQSSQSANMQDIPIVNVTPTVNNILENQITTEDPSLASEEKIKSEDGRVFEDQMALEDSQEMGLEPWI